MKTKHIWTLLLILFSLLFVTDILIRLFYCDTTSLSFNSQEFNNIASPIISLLGFLGVIVTILLTLNQLRKQQSSDYFKYYKEFIDNIATENPTNKNNIQFSTFELLQFHLFVMDKFWLLKENPEYLKDLSLYKADNPVRSEGKSYDTILGNVRLFYASLLILLRRYIMLINEIDNHRFLDNNHKEILFKHLYESQLGDYTSAVWLFDFEDELKEIKENLFISFIPEFKDKDKLKFFNREFYELFHLVEKNKTLNKLRQSDYTS
ncbi:MAG TPA: hypothetical protein VIJ75_13250 [Hanamia sp.]